MYKIVRKISVMIFVAWFAICAVYVYPQRKAEAVIPLALVPYAATVLVAAGVTFATSEELQNTTKSWLSTLPTLRTDLMQQDYNAAVNGVTNVATDVWNDAKTWVDNLINPGANTANISISDTATNTINYPLTTYGRNDLLTYTALPYMTHFYVGNTDGTYSEYGIRTPVPHTVVAIDGWVKVQAPVNTQIRYITRLTNSLETTQVYTNDGSGQKMWDCATTATIMVLAMQTSVALTGATDWVDNATRDWEYEGQRKVGVPLGGAIDELLGKSHQDVKYTGTGTTDPPADTTFDGTSEITGLSSVFNAIKAMSANIAKFFDLTTPVNLEPLRVTGDIFTTRFPFSLPWDLMRSFQLFNDNTFNPVLNINIPSGPILPNLNFNIDLSVWSNIVGYVKALELLIFDITLVLMTRKLLGGGV